jgi:flagellar assembly factor FliW
MDAARDDSMRVTDSAGLSVTTAGLAKAAERLLEFQREVPAGKRASRSSDDPSVVSTTILERSARASIGRYLEAADSARSRLVATDTVLSHLIEQLEASQVTILGARGTIRTPAQREAAAQDLEQLRDAVLRDLNASYRGCYVFGGAQCTTPPYRKNLAGVVSGYQGSTIEVSVDISDEHEVAVVFNGESLATGTDATAVFVAFDQAIAAVRADEEPQIRTALAGLGRALDRATALQSRVCASLRSIEENALQLQERERASTARLSALADANMAAAISGITAGRNDLSRRAGRGHATDPPVTHGLSEMPTPHSTSAGAAIAAATEGAGDEQDVLFPHGLPGFELCRGFALFKADAAPFQWLTSIDGPAASFLTIDPGLVLPNYRYSLGKNDLARLSADEDTPLLWRAIVLLEADGSVAANLRAPIVINPATMIGQQVMPRDCLYPLRHVIVSAQEGADSDAPGGGQHVNATPAEARCQMP